MSLLWIHFLFFIFYLFACSFVAVLEFAFSSRFYLGQYSLPCAFNHRLKSFLKVGAVITNSLMILNFTSLQPHLTFVHWMLMLSSALTLLGDRRLVIGWSWTMTKLKLFWLDLAERSACHKMTTWELAVMTFPSKAMLKISGSTLMLLCLWWSISWDQKN